MKNNGGPAFPLEKILVPIGVESKKTLHKDMEKVMSPNKRKKHEPNFTVDIIGIDKKGHSISLSHLIQEPIKAGKDWIIVTVKLP